MDGFVSGDRHHQQRRQSIAVWSDFCAVAASPDLRTRMKAELEQARGMSALARTLALSRSPRPLGFDDGVIIPPDEFPIGTPMTAIRSAALDRAPLRGSVRVIVVLVDFSDRAMTQTAAHFNDLFFSTGVLPHGSVKEYYREVTGGLVDIVGEVSGVYRLPQTLAWYANGNFGIGRPSGTARANIMAQDAATAADPNVNFGLYDNDGNGFIDAFIVVHAGRGGEQTGNSGDIWSHKWTLPSVYTTDGKKIFAYLTIPEDSRIGVCAHELGHLLFGFPDLYDTDDTSEGIGNWCLMAGGSWNGGGDVPAHPSAWCKVNQGWASVTNVTVDGPVTIPDVKSSRNLLRMWKDGTAGPEYFLLENRQQTGYDADLPGPGLLIWHIDESQPGNTDENHYKVALVQADGKRDMELDHNRGDGGDPYPGASGNTSFTVSSTPNSKSYAGQDTCVSVTKISPSGVTMTATLAVHCGKAPAKEAKDRKDAIKEPVKERKDQKDRKELAKDRKDQKDLTKEPAKERKDLKDRKEGKEAPKERKDLKDQREGKSVAKDAKDLREGKGPKEIAERPGVQGIAGGDPVMEAIAELEARVAALEEALGGGEGGDPFISADLRPDLIGGPVYEETTKPAERIAGDRGAKLALDTPPDR